jgi:thioredoxin family protein
VLLFVCLLFLSILAAAAGGVPLTARDVGLMLRSGYSSDAVMRELAARHFADAFDSTVEEQLKRAGANESLLNALRTGSYAATASEISAAKEKAIAKQKQTEPVEEVVQSPAATPPVSKFSEPAGTPAPAPAPPDAMFKFLQGDLVHFERNELRKLDDEAIAKKKLYLFFLSANSAAAARKFTPALVAFYNRIAPLHPEFETIFFSHDRSPYVMENYMRQAEMPWPAVVFERVAVKLPLQKNVLALPLLILVTNDSKILYTSSGVPNVDPDKVIADLDKVLATSSADPKAPPPLMLSNTRDYFRTQIK